MKRIETCIDLPATPSVVWKHLQDTSSYERWNPFITSLTGDLEVGQRLQVCASALLTRLEMDPSTTSTGVTP